MIRNNLRKILRERGLTVDQACEMTGLHRSVVGRLFRNEATQIPFDTLDAICKGLDVFSGEVIEYVPDEFMTDEDREHLEVRESYNKKRYRNRKQELIRRIERVKEELTDEEDIQVAEKLKEEIEEKK